MAEEEQTADSAGAGPAGVSLALAGASREAADAFLKDQQKLTRLQARELAHELDLRHWSLWVRHASGLLKLALELSAGLLALALAAGTALMMWNAAHADGLVIDAFSVPPDMSARGLTGPVVAGQMIDKLTYMQNATNSARPAKSYANNWGDNIKVDIPETGISISEVYRFLRGWLGHETHVSGEVYRTGDGIAVTARVVGDSGATYAGREADLGTLLQKAAEHLYRGTQPYRYTSYLLARGRAAEALPILKGLAESGPMQERPWGYNGWANAVSILQGIDAEMRLRRQGLSIEPDNYWLQSNLAGNDDQIGDLEASLRDGRKAISLLTDGQQMVRSEDIPVLRRYEQAHIAYLTGAFHDMATDLAAVVQSGIRGVGGQAMLLARAQSGEHDLAAARRTQAEAAGSGGDAASSLELNVDMQIDSDAQDWAAVVTDAARIAALIAKFPGERSELERFSTPLLAYAQARLGQTAAAQAGIAPTPRGCYFCLVARAKIAELLNERPRADFWFARAVAAAPSIPFAYDDWGRALLARAMPDQAIAQFRLSNQKGPHFADPLEGWGEALMAKNQSHLALAKFAEADKYAPDWGRLHLKWGEALVYAGKRDEAKAQFARAVTLDLNATDKAELARVSHV